MTHRPVLTAVFFIAALVSSGLSYGQVSDPAQQERYAAKGAKYTRGVLTCPGVSLTVTSDSGQLAGELVLYYPASPFHARASGSAAPDHRVRLAFDGALRDLSGTGTLESGVLKIDLSGTLPPLGGEKSGHACHWDLTARKGEPPVD